MTSPADVTSPSRPALIASFSFYMLPLVVGVVGNAGIVHVILTHKSLRTGVNAYIASMAALDFLACTMLVPLRMYFYLAESTLDGGELALCQSEVFCHSLVDAGRMLFLGAISFERYQAVANPFQRDKVASARRAAVTLAVMWVVMLLYAAMVTIFFYDTIMFKFCMEHSQPGRVDWALWGGIEMYFVLPLSLLTVLLVIVCYVLMFRILNIQRIKMMGHSKNPSTHKVSPAPPGSSLLFKTHLHPAVACSAIPSDVGTSVADKLRELDTVKHSVVKVAPVSWSCHQTPPACSPTKETSVFNKSSARDQNDPETVDSTGVNVGKTSTGPGADTDTVHATSDAGVDNGSRSTSALDAGNMDTSLSIRATEPTTKAADNLTSLMMSAVTDDDDDISVCELGNVRSLSTVSVPEKSYRKASRGSTPYYVRRSSAFFDVEGRVRSFFNTSERLHRLKHPSAVDSSKPLSPTALKEREGPNFGEELCSEISGTETVEGRKKIDTVTAQKDSQTFHLDSREDHSETTISNPCLQPSNNAINEGVEPENIDPSDPKNAAVSEGIRDTSNTLPSLKSSAVELNASVKTDLTNKTNMKAVSLGQVVIQNTDMCQNNKNEVILVRKTGVNSPAHVRTGNSQYADKSKSDTFDTNDHMGNTDIDQRDALVKSIKEVETGVTTVEANRHVHRGKAPKVLNSVSEHDKDTDKTTGEDKSIDLNREKTATIKYGDASPGGNTRDTVDAVNLIQEIVENTRGDTNNPVYKTVAADHHKKDCTDNTNYNTPTHNVDTEETASVEASSKDTAEELNRKPDTSKTGGETKAEETKRNTDSDKTAGGDGSIGKAGQKTSPDKRVQDVTGSVRTVNVVEMDGTAHVEQVSGSHNIQGAVCLYNPRNRVQGRRRVELKIAKRLVVIFLSFLFLWLPYPFAVLSIRLLHMQPKEGEGEGGPWRSGVEQMVKDVICVLSALTTVTAAVNPVFYGMANVTIRAVVVTKLKNIFACCRPRR
ncbi:serine-rich adhesin for platelets-like [Littorina saxatilis]|uniref:serine-rich adhesin for platelets-like n=1 Tax=Littorina saxatilis TaxID=31220 RepID=UPI0038B53418